MEKIILFASEQWLLITALAAAVWALVWLEQRRAGAALTPHALTSLINSKSTVVVDLRDKAEFDEGHIVDSINVPFSQWQTQQNGDGKTELHNYREKPLVLVCKMGQQSTHVARKISGDDFSEVYRLGGGVMEWRSAQLPLVKG